MDKRLLKQILYGAGYLTIFFSIVFFIYLVWLKPAPTCFDNKQNQGETGVDCGGPCPSCEIRILSPLESSWTKYFSIENQTAIVAEVKNFNLGWGANPFTYAFDIYGENDTKIGSLKKTSFIYGNEIKYLFDFVEIHSKNIKDVKVSFLGINWKSKEEFPKPDIKPRAVKTELTLDELGESRVVVNGFIINNNPFSISKARIIGFLFNQNSIQIGVSKTELENIKAFEEKSFKINFPKNISLMTAQKAFSPHVFARDLTIGSKGEDVKKLEEILKKDGLLDREPTDYFDSAAKNALIQYQKKAGISPAAGYFGPKTRNYINSLPAAAPPSTTNLYGVDPNKTKVYIEALR